MTALHPECSQHGLSHSRRESAPVDRDANDLVMGDGQPADRTWVSIDHFIHPPVFDVDRLYIHIMDVNYGFNPFLHIQWRDAQMLDTTWESMRAEPRTVPAIVSLAACCSDVGRAPERTHSAVRRTLLDTLGVAAAGGKTDAGQASARSAHEIFGCGDGLAWFSKSRLTPVGAAFVNATYAAALDLDDGHRQASGHPAAAIVPAVLAVAERYNCGADRLLTAIALGYEVAVRISAARDISVLRTTDTGLWCGPGVAAAIGWLTGQAPMIVAHGMAIAAQTATSQAATGWTAYGHTVKEGIPWATANGVAAISLAKAGHRGPLDALDDPSAYSRNRLLDDFGLNWAIEGAYFKLYSCCRWAHAAIDGALALQERIGISHDAIQHVEIETFERALSLPNQVEPQSPEAAQYSVPFCVALALVHGTQALLPMDNKFLADTRVTGLAKRIELCSGSGYASAFPASTPARVTIRAGNVVKSIEVRFPKGEPQNPLSDSELQQKFSTLAAHLGDQTAFLISRAVSGLGIHQQPAGLFAALGGAG